MRKIYFIVVFVILFYSSFVLAFPSTNQIILKVQFDSAPNGTFYDHSLHINKIIKINPRQKKNKIVMTQSSIVNNFPVTLAMLVKAVNQENNEIALQFNLVHYGFNKMGSVITQPKMILKNGQAGEMEFGPYKLKVIANRV